MSRQILLGIGLLFVVIGVLWTGQGLGWIRVQESFMTDSLTWAIIGPITALAGVGLVVRAVRKG